MQKTLSLKEKFINLQPWIPSVVNSIKRELKNEHLKKDPRFAKKYFGNKNVSRITNDELTDGYFQAIQQEEGAEQLAEYMSNHWLLKHTDVYAFFEDKLKEISPNFTDLVEIEKPKAMSIMEESVRQFGASDTYLFCVINAVVFPADVYEVLKKRALDYLKTGAEESQVNNEQLSLANIHTTYQQQIARLTDRYEKRLVGLERKYFNDTESFKKQIALLQRKTAGK